MINKLIILLITILPLVVTGQQQGSNSQYLLNHLGINPAYTGYHRTLAANSFFRFQNLGIKDAPNSQTFNVHSPVLEDYLSGGVQVWNQSIGIARQTGILASSSYRIQTSSLTVSMGLQAGVKISESNYQTLSTRQPDDPVFSDNLRNTQPSIGTGVLVYTDQYYFGISVPELIENEDGLFGTGSVLATGGYTFPVGPEVKLRPNFLVRYYSQEVSEINVNLSAVFRDILTTGVSYQPGRSITGLLQLFITDQFQIGYTYDALINDLNISSSGSHEVGLQYLFKMPRRNVISPRNF